MRTASNASRGEGSTLVWIDWTGEHWVDGNPAALPHAFHPDHEVSVCGDGRQQYALAEAGAQTQDRVLDLYAAKYGPDRGAVLLRLISR